MSAHEWLLQAATGMDAPPAVDATHDEPEATVGGLNFMSAIDAHMKWKTSLQDKIDDGSADDRAVDAATRDDQCTLGRWLNGPGAERFGTLPAFGEVRAEHARFHLCAGKVLAASRDGRRREALDMLDHGEYLAASRQVTILLARLYVQIAENEGAGSAG